MSQYKVEPEFILEESEKMRLMEKQLDSTTRDYNQVVVELLLLSAQVQQLEASSGNIGNQLLVLARSLQEPQ